MTRAGPARAPTALWRRNSSGDTRQLRPRLKKARPNRVALLDLTSELHPLLPRNRENECRKTSKSGFPLKGHAVFLRHPTRCLIIGMDQRNHALEFQIAK